MDIPGEYDVQGLGEMRSAHVLHAGRCRDASVHTSSMANSCGTHAHRQVNLEASEAAVDPTVSDSDSCRGLGVHWALRVIYVTAPNHRGVVAPSQAIDKGSCTGANGVGSYAH